MSMIIMGGSRGNGGFWGAYLDEAQGLENGNEAAKLMEMRGVTATTTRGFFQEIGAIASGTRCDNPFYIVSMNPERGENLTPAQVFRAFDVLEKNLGLEGQPRLIVEHIYNDRPHYHCGWSRIDLETMTARPDSHNFRQHELTARQLEIELGLKPQLSSWEKEGQRPERGPEYWEQQRAKKTGIDIKEMKAELTGLWQRSDSGRAFKAAVEEQGYKLALGDRRDFVVVDHAGKIHSLPKRLEGVKTAEVREHLADIDRGSLPTAKQAEAQQQARFTKDGKFDAEAAAEAWRNRPGAAPQAKPEIAPQPQPKFDSEAAAEVLLPWTEQAVRAGPATRPKPEQPQAEATPRAKPAAEAAQGPQKRTRGVHVGAVEDAAKQSASPAEFVRALQEKGYILTRATKDDLPIREAENRKAHDKGWNPPRHWGEGSLIVVNRFGGVTPVDPIVSQGGTRTIDGAPVENTHKLRGLDDMPLPSVSDGQLIMQNASRREFQGKRLEEKPLTFAESVIDRTANSRAINATFGEQLDRFGITIARATPEDIAQLKAEHDTRMEKLVPGQRWKAPQIEVGELMAVTRRGQAQRLNWMKLDVPGIADKLTAEGRKIGTVGEVRAVRQQETKQRAEARQEYWSKRDYDRGQSRPGNPKQPNTGRQAGRGAEKAAGAAASALGSVADVFASILSFGATSTPQEKKTVDQLLREEIAADHRHTAEVLRDLQAGMGDKFGTQTDHTNATANDLTNRASGDGSAAAELMRREMEERERMNRGNGIR